MDDNRITPKDCARGIRDQETRGIQSKHVGKGRQTAAASYYPFSRSRADHRGCRRPLLCHGHLRASRCSSIQCSLVRAGYTPDDGDGGVPVRQAGPDHRPGLRCSPGTIAAMAIHCILAAVLVGNTIEAGAVSRECDRCLSRPRYLSCQARSQTP
jgi:hypothetical protein